MLSVQFIPCFVVFRNTHRGNRTILPICYPRGNDGSLHQLLKLIQASVALEVTLSIHKDIGRKRG